MSATPPPEDPDATRRLDPVEPDAWPGEEDETVVRDPYAGQPAYREEPAYAPPPTHRYREDTRYAEPPPEPPASTWWIWLVALLVLVVAGLAAYLLLSRDDAAALETVPNVVQLQADDAERILRDEGFDVAREDEEAEAEEGTVVAQDPAAGTRLERGETVTIRVSTGPAETDVPSVVGLPEERAVERLAEAGLEVNRNEVPSEEPPGTVVAQSPAAGETVPRGTRVRINVSGGTGRVEVPDVVGLDRDGAVAALEEAGLVADAAEVDSTEPAGTVVAQAPGAGSEVREGSSVRIEVSVGIVEVPDVVGQQEADAVAALEGAGLRANVVRVPSGEPEGTVVAQNPRGGEARTGTTVRINVSRG
jgi:beta-lactam-binding protein with PASTA domain